MARVVRVLTSLMKQSLNCSSVVLCECVSVRERIAVIRILTSFMKQSLNFSSVALWLTMADQVTVPAPAVQPAGPLQRGRGVQGHYVYWITMPNPLPETVASCGVRRPSEYTRQEFTALGVAVHAACGMELLEIGSPPPSARLPRAPGAAQTYKNQDFRSSVPTPWRARPL